jgi:hypothetical protein
MIIIVVGVIQNGKGVEWLISHGFQLSYSPLYRTLMFDADTCIALCTLGVIAIIMYLAIGCSVQIGVDFISKKINSISNMKIAKCPMNK